MATDRIERLRTVARRADRGRKARHKRLVQMLRSRGFEMSEDRSRWEHRCGRPEKSIELGWVRFLWELPQEAAEALLDEVLADVPEEQRRERQWLELPEFVDFQGAARALTVLNLALETLVEKGVR